MSQQPGEGATAPPDIIYIIRHGEKPADPPAVAPGEASPAPVPHHRAAASPATRPAAPVQISRLRDTPAGDIWLSGIASAPSAGWARFRGFRQLAR